MPAGENGEQGGPEELGARLRMREVRLRELHEELAALRLAADEARAFREAGEERVRRLEEERGRLKERIRTLEERLRDGRRDREGYERRLGRLQRELERREAEISRRGGIIRRREQEMESLRREAGELVARKDRALQDALRRVVGLERDLEERENEIQRLRQEIEGLEERLERERELRRRLAEPANLLRAGIELFNESGHLRTVGSLSRTLGPPEVHVELEEGGEPAVLLTFTWQGISWQTYAANPHPDVEEPRVYLKSAGEDLSGVETKPPNARIGPGGKVLLGL
jgi:ribonuclease Y